MELYIDDREDNERIDLIKKNFSSPIIVHRLEVGDIIVKRKDKPDIIFEIKTIQDFIGSCKNRRMKKEALQMKDYPYRYVIIYDDGKWNKAYTNQTINEKFGNLAAININYRATVFWCLNKKEFIACLKAIIRSVDKDTEPVEPPVVRKKDTNEMINVLIGLPDVGTKMARTLLDIFQTPGKVFKASDEELDNVRLLRQKSKDAIKRMR